VVIAANDDSIRAIGLILNELAEAVATGKTMETVRRDITSKPKRVRPRRPVLARAGGKEEPASTAVEGAKETPQEVPQPADDKPQEPETT
jgi:ribosomal protein S2